MDDGQAIAAALSGDERGYQVLFERYHERLVRYVGAVSRLGREEVLDVVQEAFIRVFRGLARIEQRDKLYPVLRATARNRAWSLLAKRRRRQDIFDEVWRSLTLAPLLQASDVPKERLTALANELIATLPPGEIRQTVEAYYLGEECSTEELAERLGVPKGTITARLKRFRDDVKRRLAAGLLALDYEP